MQINIYPNEKFSDDEIFAFFHKVVSFLTPFFPNAKLDEEGSSMLDCNDNLIALCQADSYGGGIELEIHVYIEPLLEQGMSPESVLDLLRLLRKVEVNSPDKTMG